MIRNPLPRHAPSTPASPDDWQAGPIQALTTLLLYRLLEDDGGARYAWVSVDPGTEPGSGGASNGSGSDGAATSGLDGLSGSWEISAPEPGLPADWPEPGDSLVTVSAALSDGRILTLTTGPVVDRDSLSATAQRYLSPVRMVVDLGLRLRSDRMRAQAAVDAVQGVALLDLATGIVMARRSTDPQTARDALAAWSLRTGTSVDDLTASTMLDLLTGEEFRPS